jgi:hypothetical protein
MAFVVAHGYAVQSSVPLDKYLREAQPRVHGTSHAPQPLLTNTPTITASNQPCALPPEPTKMGAPCSAPRVEIS